MREEASEQGIPQQEKNTIFGRLRATGKERWRRYERSSTKKEINRKIYNKEREMR